MNIVLDTNVFISGIFFSGPPYEILKAWKNSRIQIVLTQQILEEYQRVAESLAEQFPTVDSKAFLNLALKGGVKESIIKLEISLQ